MSSPHFGKLVVLVSAVGVLTCGFTHAVAQEVWSAREGTITVDLDNGTLEQLGLQVEGPGGREMVSDPFSTYALPLDGGVDIQFSVLEGGQIQLFSTDLRAVDGITLRTAQAEVTVLDFVLLEGAHETTAGTGDATKVGRGPAHFEVSGLKAGMNRQTDTFGLAGRELSISLALAVDLDRLELAGVTIGRIVVSAPSEWIGGDAPAPFQAGPLDGDDVGDRGGRTGCDMVFCQLYGLFMPSGARVGDIVGTALATTSWNISDDTDCIWLNNPDEEHPFIVMNLFRLKTVDGSDRFEQIGQSWIKHGFYALASHQCGGPACRFEPGHGAGDWLGMGCTDTYGASLNASQGGMGPRFEIDPWAGAYYYPGSHMQGGHSHNPIEHRLQLHDSDLDAPQNPGATYYGEGYYVMLDDVDVMNSASWKPVTVSGSPGGSWSFGMSGSGTFPEVGFAYKAWPGAMLTTLAEELPVVEFVSPDGRCVLSAKSTDLGGGTWHYEYALYNIDTDRQVGSFSIPISPGTLVTNEGFHAVEHHDEAFNTVDGDAVPIDNAPWTLDVTSDAVTWSTVSNPLRWGTMYNFRFDANVEPAPDRTTVTLGLFRPGTPTELTGETIGPMLGPPDCNLNDIPDDCDLDCGPSGGACDVPGCGGSGDCDGSGIPDECEGGCNDNGVPDECDVDPADPDGNGQVSADCNGNGVPDECEGDCQPNGVPDDCDVDPADPDGNGQVSADCNGNGVPDECELDSDGDGVIDDCDICPGFDDNVDTDGDGVPDGCDACPGFDDSLDSDEDGVPNDCDNCPDDFNPSQGDEDEDGVGNACDDDYCSPTVTDEHFDTDPGWTVVNDGATAGDWDWGDPVGGGDRWDPADDFDGGGACYLTGNTDGDSDVDGGTTRLLSPIYDLSGGDASIDYWYWIGTNGTTDSLVVEVSNNGGASWTTLATYTSNNEAWVEDTFFLDAVLPMTDQVQFRFSATDGGSPSVMEAGIDAVLITAECDPGSQDCNGNEIPDRCDIDCGVPGGECDVPLCGLSDDTDGNGIPDECEGPGDPIRGGRMWDNWWADSGVPEPTGDHPLYPPAGQQSGSTTYRCKECHGWDYKGVDGAYASGSHYTGIPGVFGSTMTAGQMFNLIKSSVGSNAHGFQSYGLTDVDVWDLVQFVQDLAIDTDNYIDPAAQFLGDPVNGEVEYSTGGFIPCSSCHGPDGTWINFGSPVSPQWVGTIAVGNPWELLHKIRFGQPGQPMLSYLEYAGTDQGAADIGRHAQVEFPVECIDASYCDDDEACTYDTCDGQYCDNEYRQVLFADIAAWFGWEPGAPRQPDLDDIMCVLDAFGTGGDPAACSGSDLVPCDVLDGTVDLEDIFAILDSFEGNPPCSAPCP